METERFELVEIICQQVDGLSFNWYRRVPLEPCGLFLGRVSECQLNVVNRRSAKSYQLVIRVTEGCVDGFGRGFNAECIFPTLSRDDVGLRAFDCCDRCHGLVAFSFQVICL